MAKFTAMCLALFVCACSTPSPAPRDIASTQALSSREPTSSQSPWTPPTEPPATAPTTASSTDKTAAKSMTAAGYVDCQNYRVTNIYPVRVAPAISGEENEKVVFRADLYSWDPATSTFIFRHSGRWLYQWPAPAGRLFPTVASWFFSPGGEFTFGTSFNNLQKGVAWRIAVETYWFAANGVQENYTYVWNPEYRDANGVFPHPYCRW